MAAASLRGSISRRPRTGLPAPALGVIIDAQSAPSKKACDPRGRQREGEKHASASSLAGRAGRDRGRERFGCGPGQLLDRSGEALRGRHYSRCLESTPPSNYVKDVLAPQFTEQTGINVEFEVTSWDQMYDKAIKDMEANTGIYDFVYIEQDIIYSYLSRDFLVKASCWRNRRSSRRPTSASTRSRASSTTSRTPKPATSTACRWRPSSRFTCTARTCSRTLTPRPPSRRSTATTWRPPPPTTSTATSPSSSRSGAKTTTWSCGDDGPGGLRASGVVLRVLRDHCA